MLTASYVVSFQMCEPHGVPNLLTSPSDEQWKAIRRAVAVSFSHKHIRNKFPVVLAKCDELTERIRGLGPEAAIDVDQAALRVTLDVIGLVRPVPAGNRPISSPQAIRSSFKCFKFVLIANAMNCLGLLLYNFSGLICCMRAAPKIQEHTYH